MTATSGRLAAATLCLATLWPGLPASAQTAPGVLITGTVRLRDDARPPAVVYVPWSPPSVRDTVVIDQFHLTYTPGLTVVAPGTPVRFRNSDPVVHNVFSPSAGTGRFDLGRYTSDESRVHVFSDSGSALILCRIHPEMVARVLVVNARVWTLTAPDGAFHMEVPPGTREVVVWHPRLGERRVTLDATPGRPIEIQLR